MKIVSKKIVFRKRKSLKKSEKKQFKNISIEVFPQNT